MWASQRLASIGLESLQGKAQARRRDRRGIRPIVTLLEERTLLSNVPGTWTVVAPLPVPRVELVTVTGLNGLIYAIGGNTSSGMTSEVDAYNSATNTWTTVASLPTARTNSAAAVGSNGLIYAIGGETSGSRVTSEVDAYNSATNTWTTVAGLPTARFFLAAATGSNGLIYAIGGANTNGVPTNEVDAYNPATNTWKTVASLPTAREYPAAATGSNGLIYAIGGSDDGNYFTSEVDAYNPATNTWTTVASLPSARATSAVAGSDGRIYAIGGSWGSYPFTSEVDAYNPAINTWTTGASLPDGRYGLGAASGPDGRIYAIGGAVYEDGQSQAYSTAEVDAYTQPLLSQTINFGPLANRTYGVTPITLTATDTSGLPVSFSVISGPATITGSVLTVTGMGNVVVEADQPGNTTYAAATPVDKSFTVAPAQLTVNATNESMTDGGTVPALTFTYTGLVNGDTSATFSGSLATTATKASSVGSYPITQGSLAATGNYTIRTYDPGTLTVNAGPLTVTVTTLADDPTGSIPGYTTLRDAITEANTGPTRSVEITFAVTGTIDLTSALPALNNNITISGPGAASLTVQRDPSAAPFSVFTVLSGETVSLSSMTVTGGNATTTMGLGNISGEGGGIYNAGSLTVTDSAFTNNSANVGFNNGGGGIYNAGSLIVTDSAFTNNSAPSGNGGGIDNWGSLTVTGSTFTGNSADGGWGGGIENAAAMTVTDSAFTGNSASWGGGIFNSHSADYQSGTVTVNGSTFTSNSAAGWGGAIANNGGTLSITGNTFHSNSSGYGGGGIYNNGGTVGATDSTFTNNSAVFGGGVCNGGYEGHTVCTATLTNCTIDGNSGQGGGVYNFGTLTLNNTIVADNNSGGFRPTQDDVWGTVQPTSAHNLLGLGLGALTNLAQLDSSNLTGKTANLGPLASNGGPTLTMALLPGSPAIDAGSNTLAVDPATGQPLAYDQRGVGFPRIVNGTVDIGAFESSGFTVTVTSGSGQSTGPLTAFSALLVATVTANNPSEPVAGGLVTFTTPPIGASATLSGSPATISATGTASVAATANSIVGSYTVSATASGITTPASFSLTNMWVPTFSAPISPTIVYGTSTTTLTGHLGSGTAYPTGSNVSITLNSVTQTASVDGSGDFTTTFSTGSLGVAGGPYTVTYAFAGNSSFTAATDTSTTLTVTAAPLTASIIGDPAKTYDGTTSATLTQANFSLSGLVGTQSFTVTPTVGTYNSKDVTAATTVMASLSPSDFTSGSGTVASNYILPTTASGAGTITPKALTYSGLSVPASKVYDGTTTAEVSRSAALQTAEAAGTGSTADGKPYSVDSVSLTGTPTGTYNSKDVATATTVTFGGLALTGTGNGDYTLTASTQAATITPRTVTASIIGDPSKTYNGSTSATLSPSNFSLTGVISGESFTVTQTAGTYNSKDVYTATTVTASLSAGNFMPGSGTLASDYTLPTTASGAGNINAALLTVTATNESMVYGGTVPALTYTYTGLVNNDTSATFSGSLATTATSSSSVGDYPITVGTLAATGNYTIGTYHPGTLTVKPASLTITANNTTKVYGTTATLSYIAGGLVNNNTVTSVIETSAGAVSTASVGSYPILISDTVGTGLNNYNITYVDGTLTVTPATANVVVTPYDVTYNGQPHTVSGKATGVNGVALPASDLNLTGTTHTNAGTYTDTWTFTDPNYVSQSGTVTDTIQKANATIHVTSYDVTYAGTAHTATGTATLWVGPLAPNGTPMPGLGTTITIAGLNLGGTTHTNAGTYTDAWTFSNPNYVSQSGKITDIINKANAYIVVSPYNVVFNDQAHAATGYAVGVNGQLLPGLNLSGTAHLGGYYTNTFHDRWTFTDTTGNYNSTSGIVVDVIRGNPALYRAVFKPFCPKSPFHGRLFMW